MVGCMDTVLILLFLGLIAAAAVVAWQGSRKRAAERGSAAAAQPIGATGVRALKVSDVVHHEGRDYIVEGTLRFDEGGFRWDEHRLVDGSDSLWLSVEDDEGLEVVVWERLRGAQLEPGPATLEHDGVTYELDERGKADFTSQGSTGAAGGGTAEYADYARGDQRLSFERFGREDGGWEVSVGSRISEHALDIYPSGTTS